MLKELLLKTIKEEENTDISDEPETKVYLSYQRAWSKQLNKLKDIIDNNQLEDRIAVYDQINIVDLYKQTNDILYRGKFITCTLSEMQDKKNDCFAKEIDQSVDTVIELGSGWGRNIFYLFNQDKPKNINYWAGEYASVGRTVSRSLANLYPEYQLNIFAYDYNSPSLSKISKCNKLVLYTIYSVEQITELKIEVIRQVLELADDVVGVHLEPVGWQMKEEVNQSHLPGISEQCTGGRSYYNQNLWKVLKQLEQEKEIIIDQVDTAYFGYARNVNVISGTYIRWHKIPKN